MLSSLAIRHVAIFCLAVFCVAIHGLAAALGAEAELPPFVVRAVERRPETLAEEWQAAWIWGRVRPHGARGCFRKVFEVAPGLQRAWIQSSGDDAYVLHLNGEEAGRGSFYWKRTDRFDVTARLRTGSNSISAEVHNAADPGGLLLELTLLYEDGRSETVATNGEWRFSSNPREGWRAREADEASDPTWTSCEEMGRPPAALPWGELPHEFLGRRTALLVAGTEFPDRLEAGEPFRAHLDLAPGPRPRGDLALTVRVSREGAVVSADLRSLEPPPDAWPRDRSIRIELPDLSGSRFFGRGPHTLECGIAHATLSGRPFFERPLEVRNARQGVLTPVRIGEHGGAPALFVSGRPVFPMGFWQSEIRSEDALAFHRAGVDFLTFASPQYYLHPGWTGEGRYEYAEFDSIMLRVLRANPEALCMPRIFVGAPEWWIDAHPEEAVRFATGIGWQANGWGGTKHESFASLEWQRDAGEALARFVRHIRGSPYSDRVIGIHVIDGIYGEWHAWSATDIPDTSEPMRVALVKHLRARYGNDAEKLRRAWGDPAVDFDSVSIPTLLERRKGDTGMFRDPARSRKVADYYQCLHEVTVDAIDHFSGIVKRESGGGLFTCVFYSYAPDLDWPQEGDHRAAARAHRLASIDVFSSPHSYARRRLGEDGLFRNYPATLAAHGKLFLDEADDRTHRARDPAFTHVKTLEESIEVVRREFANAVTHAVGLWYMDQQGDWFHDPALMAEIARLKLLGDLSMEAPRGTVAEVAVISSLRSEFHLAGRDSGANAVTFALHVDQVGELCRSGAPFDWYLIEDLVEGRVPRHRVYVFLDVFALSRGEREAIARLKTGGTTLLWFHAPGYVTEEGLSLEGIRDATGIPAVERARGLLRARVEPGIAETAPAEFGPGKEQSPIFVPDSEDAAVWARHSDRGDPALVVEDFPGWRSVFCSVPGLPAAILRRLWRESGVHIYCDSGDNLTANQSWIGLHSASAGKKTIRLSRPSRVRDAIHDRVIGEDLREFEIEMAQGTTALFFVAPAE